ADELRQARADRDELAVMLRTAQSDVAAVTERLQRSETRNRELAAADDVARHEKLKPPPKPRLGDRVPSGPGLLSGLSYARCRSLRGCFHSRSGRLWEALRRDWS